MARLRLVDLHKYYGKVHAVRGVNLEIPEGEFTVVVGPSGCGKSTLLRIIAGLEDADRGLIEIDGARINDVRPRDRNVAMVFQSYALYPYLTVFENIAFGLRARKVKRPEIDAAVRGAAKTLGIGALLERYPRELSGGQRQRVAMGRAIVRKPAAFLFDEPLSNLDAKLRVQMRIEIRKLQRSLGTTSIYVTHDQLEAMTLADRLVVMNGGRMEQVGTALEVFEKPATTFVAGFIGSPPMNFLPASVEAPGRLRLAGGASLAYDPAVSGAPEGAKVLAGLRPETVAIVAAGQQGQNQSQSTWPRLKIELIEELGMGRLVHGRISESAFTVAQGPSEARPQGADFVIEVAPRAIHLFDAASGARL